MNMFGIGMDIMSIMTTFVILIGILLGKKNYKNQYFPSMLLLNALTLLADIGTVTFEQDVSCLTVYKVCIILLFTFIFCDIAVFSMYVDAMINIGNVKRKSRVFCLVPALVAAVMSILWLSSVKTGYLFSIDEKGVLVYGQYFWIVQLVIFALAMSDVTRVIVNQLMGKIDRVAATGIYIYVTLLTCALPFGEVISNQSLLAAAIAISHLVMYILIHVRQEQTRLTKKIDAEKMQTELIMSQIQPHFIFNALTTIKYLCSTNSQLAIEAVSKFAKYLRRNLDVVSDNNMVKFKYELEHTMNYLWLEQLRFGKMLNVEYSIDCDDFLIPPLSLQPIVENAVKHGVTKKSGGGTVTITVRETDISYKITVSDDGLGFDKQEKGQDDEAHIGINDVRKRISEIKGSTLSVNSQVGVGTSVEYEIMKQ